METPVVEYFDNFIWTPGRLGKFISHNLGDEKKLKWKDEKSVKWNYDVDRERQINRINK
jgi:hypothetical protein